MDGKIVLDKKDDVALVKLGAPWCMPTEVEFKELIEKCTWIWTKWHDIQGYKVVGPNGKYIFLPKAGFNYEDSRAGDHISTQRRTFDDVSYNGCYWACNRSNNECAGKQLVFSERAGDIKIDDRMRCVGVSIRPVFK